MKTYAVNYLAETLKGDFKFYEPFQIESKILATHSLSTGFAREVAYIIQREIDLSNSNTYNFLKMVQDGMFGNTHSLHSLCCRSWTGSRCFKGTLDHHTLRPGMEQPHPQR
jgi:hypothetical protein